MSLTVAAVFGVLSVSLGVSIRARIVLTRLCALLIAHIECMLVSVLPGVDIAKSEGSPPSSVVLALLVGNLVAESAA